MVGYKSYKSLVVVVHGTIVARRAVKSSVVKKTLYARTVVLLFFLVGVLEAQMCSEASADTMLPSACNYTLMKTVPVGTPRGVC